MNKEMEILFDEMIDNEIEELKLRENQDIGNGGVGL